MLESEGGLVYLLDVLGGLLGEVPHQALQDGSGDVLFKLGLAHSGAHVEALDTIWKKPEYADNVLDGLLKRNVEL